MNPESLVAPPGAPSIFESPVDELLHPELELWRSNVGEPVALDLAPPGPSSISGLDVLCWNVAIGAARLGQLLELVRAGAFTDIGSHPARPLILLIQEAYRSDRSVPEIMGASRFHGGAAHRPGADDIVEVAREHGLSLRYAPSMRNGAHCSDRGNAILSTLPLGTSHAFVLPYVKQRRVVVAAELDGVPDLAVVSAHLDVGGQPRTGPRIGAFGAGRAAQAAALAERIAQRGDAHCLVVGADLNTHLGPRDPALRALIDAGLILGRRLGEWRHTYHGPVRLLLDHVLFRSPTGRIAEVRVTRIDEQPRDAGSRVFGSDHHPLLARVDFRTPLERHR